MPDMKALLAQVDAAGGVSPLVTSKRIQFGPENRRYIGAEILPERIVPQNEYRQHNIRSRAVIANAGARYGPAQKKGGAFVSSFLVELGESDLAREFTSEHFDALRGYGAEVGSMSNAMAFIRFVDDVLTGLVEHNEKERWQAIVSAIVTRTGDNGFAESISYANPSGHRFNASVVWSNAANDPFVDIMTAADLLASKGKTVRRIVAPRPVLTIMANNPKVQARVGFPMANTAGTITVVQARATQDAINAALQRDGLPNIETYDLQYRTQSGTGYFLARNVLVMIGSTGENVQLDLGDNQNLNLMDTLGYVGMGTPAGQDTPGRALDIAAYTNKPPRIEVEAWQTSLPVIMDPEAIAVIGNIS
jgi:hypothetical protein